LSRLKTASAAAAYLVVELVFILIIPSKVEIFKEKEKDRDKYYRNAAATTNE
jgi:hypothetical protein